MDNWKKTLILPDATIREAVATIDAGGVHIALVVASDGTLQGVITDGDVRRGILAGVSLEASVTQLMNTSPATVAEDEDLQQVVALMRQLHRYQIPVLDKAGRVVGLRVLTDLLQPEKNETPVVLMAGGLGMRLRPITDDVPKPLVQVGSKPILETILESFVSQGFYRFYISVNYKAELIKAHLGDGSHWGVDIVYLNEETQRGTAGSLSLIPQEELPGQVLVMNGDLLTKLNFGQLLDFHRRHQSAATLCVREYDYQIPYGVVENEGHRMVSIREKPVQRCLVNAGVYVLEKQALAYIPAHGSFDMTDLFDRLVQDGRKATVFPIREYWLDIGRVEDLTRASDDFNKIFS